VLSCAAVIHCLSMARMRPLECVVPRAHVPKLQMSSVTGLAVDGQVSNLSIDWSFLDAAFIITCPNVDGSNQRLERALDTLDHVGLRELTEVREFATDDKDRVRGCYSSHISVLQEAEQRLRGKANINVLVLEDNLEVSPRISQDTLDAVEHFIRCSAGNAGVCPDMVHLAYIMYVPGLSVERHSQHIVRLRCSPDSVLGTTAYIITRRGLDTLLQEHATNGYVDAIPNVMARLFADSRFAAFPMPFHRAASVKSLVNSQLDALRSLLFQPQVFTLWERLLVGSGKNTNVLFPSLCLLLLLGALGGFSETATAILANRRGESVGLALPVLSAALATSCLVVLGYGLALAPKPQPLTEPDTTQLPSR